MYIQVELLATAEKLPRKNLLILSLLQFFFLPDYISDYEKPMEASFVLVEEILPGYGFDRENVEAARKIIRNSFNDNHEIDYLTIFFMMQDMIIWAGLIILSLPISCSGKGTNMVNVTDRNEWIEIQKKLLIRS